MRAYYAVIKDSFREALSSRVLWILLVLATLLLAAIVPLSITDHLSSSLAAADIANVVGLAIKLDKQGAAEPDSPAKRIWTRLDPKLRARLSAVAANPQDRAAAAACEGELRGDLNALLSQRELYEKAAWANAKPGAEANKLLVRGVDKLSEDELRRFNRLLLEAAFPAEIAPSRPVEISLAYFGYSFGGPIPLEKDFVVKSALTAFMNFILGTLGVFSAILVTASIIPHTFEAGAIDLLLSKPISRFWLFVTKFVGGCAFTLINAAYVIGGLWLIVGLRYGLWSGRLLLCIPLFMFLFAIYYAVSALAGVIWKNAIICVVMTVVFWVACFTVGLSKGVIETVFLNSRRLVRVEQAGDVLLAVNERNQVLFWQPDQSAWQPIVLPQAKDDPNDFAVSIGRPFTTVGPVYDAARRRLLVIRPPAGRAGLMSPNAFLFVGRAEDGWRLTQSIGAPPGTTGLFVTAAGDVLTVGAQGVFRLEGEETLRPQQAAPDAAPPEGPPTPSRAKFVEIGPAAGFGGQPTAAIDAATGSLAVYNRPRLRILKANEKGEYSQSVRTDIEPAQPGVVGFGGANVVLALADGTIDVFDAGDLELQEEFTAPAPRTPRFVLVSPDGRWLAVLFHNGRLWLYDAQNKQDVSRSIAGQGAISAVALAGSNELLVADRFTRVTRYGLDPLKQVASMQPSDDFLESSYHYALKPIYTVFPKPGELGNMVSYLLTEQDTASTTGREDDLLSARVKIDVWGPIWSNLAFLAVVVCLGGLYTKYKDF